MTARNLWKITRLRERNLLSIVAQSWEVIVDIVKRFFSQMGASFHFPKREQAKMSNLQIKTTAWSVWDTVLLSFIHFWWVMSKNEITGLCFFENENVIGSTYKRMLRYFLFPRTRDYLQSMIFQHNSSPPYYANEVRQYLDTRLLDRWMGECERWCNSEIL